MGTYGNCALFVSHTVLPFESPLPSIYLLRLVCAESERMISSAFPCRRKKILSVWSGRQKYGQHNRISSLVSAFLPCGDIPMRTHFCCANHTWISAGCFLSGHERQEDRRKRCKMEREREKRGRALWGITGPEIHRAPSWIEVIIISWPSIVLVLIAFQEGVILCSAVCSQSDILFMCVCLSAVAY